MEKPLNNSLWINWHKTRVVCASRSGRVPKTTYNQIRYSFVRSFVQAPSVQMIKVRIDSYIN